MSDLDQSTNEELIEELMRRTAFRGLVVWQVPSFKGEPVTDWRWRSKNCDARGVALDLLPQLPEAEES